ncbi:hypothetical protein GCM10027190_02030 [Spirosoma areae]
MHPRFKAYLTDIAAKRHRHRYLMLGRYVECAVDLEEGMHGAGEGLPQSDSRHFILGGRERHAYWLPRHGLGGVCPNG